MSLQALLSDKFVDVWDVLEKAMGVQDLLYLLHNFQIEEVGAGHRLPVIVMIIGHSGCRGDL